MHERQQVAKLQQIIESLRIELADCQLCNNKLQAELKHKVKSWLFENIASLFYNVFKAK